MSSTRVTEKHFLPLWKNRTYSKEGLKGRLISYLQRCRLDCLLVDRCARRSSILRGTRSATLRGDKDKHVEMSTGEQPLGFRVGELRVGPSQAIVQAGIERLHRSCEVVHGIEQGRRGRLYKFGA